MCDKCTNVLLAALNQHQMPVEKAFNKECFELVGNSLYFKPTTIQYVRELFTHVENDQITITTAVESMKEIGVEFVNIDGDFYAVAPIAHNDEIECGTIYVSSFNA